MSVYDVPAFCIMLMDNVFALLYDSVYVLTFDTSEKVNFHFALRFLQ